MKTKFKILTVLAVAALVLFAPQASAGLGDPAAIMSYTSTAYSIGGTNGAAGYTNTAVYADVSGGSTVTFLVHLQGYSVNLSNATTLVVRPAFSSATADIATTAQRYAIVPNGLTAVNTNIVITSFGAPGCTVTLENPDTNPVSITNLVVKVFTKNP